MRFFFKDITNVIWRILAWMLCIAIVFNLTLSVSHLKHHHHDVVCSEESEKDACHRFVFHHEKSNDCNGSHKHITTKDGDCFACKYSNNNCYDLPQQFILAYKNNFNQTLTPKSSKTPLNTLRYFLSRGPPQN